MTVVVRDLVPAFLEFWAGGAHRERWDDYVARHPEVLNDLVRFGQTFEPAGLDEVLTTYAELEPRIRANAPLASGWIEEAADIVLPLLEAAHLDVPCVAMVGVATSNGWVSEVDGRPTLFLAVEMVPDERAARILAAHELAHAAQQPLPSQPWPEEGPLGMEVFREGFATALTAEVFPEYGLAEQLWFGPGYDDWLVRCERVLPEAQAAILADLHSEDREVAFRYLALHGRTAFPKRIGYLVGTRMIQELRREHGLADLARWSTDRAIAEVRRQLAGTLSG